MALAGLNVLPHLVFGLPAGLVVSRFSLRRLLVVADVGRAVLLGALTSGLLATTLGLRPTFILTTLGMLSAALYSARSPLRHTR
ncbi:hypothetical protein [Kribbella sp. NPDC051718]|uniref:hypothetical protein n=1 Tax=Kribbella sp. NPDC051718 TaxID=3155168 RepID=UPI003421168B